MMLQEVTHDMMVNMTGPELIKLADEFNIKVSCDKTHTRLAEAKSTVMARILMAKMSETPVETPDSLPDEFLDDSKQNIKAETKRPNLKLSELNYKGETKTIRQWADELNIPWATLYDRVNRNGWTTEEALETPVGQRRKK